MPTIRLPADARLDGLRDRARALQRAVRAGDAAALGRVAARHSAEVSPGAFPLSLARLVIAREHGFASWPRLKRHLDVLARHRRDLDPAARADPAEEFCRLACLAYDGDDAPERRARARRLLATRPDLPRGDIGAAAAASDPDAVRDLLAGDRSLARREAGPYALPPLLYLTYSRLDPEVREEPVLAVARLLLRAGADPNAGFLWQGLAPPFTALTGAFGEGESGPGRQPRHPHSSALARLLLSAGADPNDGQALYNRMFRPGDDHLELLFAYGLGEGDGGPWRARLGDALDTPAELVRGQLTWAIDHGFAGRVRLLAAHGADVRSPLPDGRTPVEAAARGGHTEIVTLLEAAGARGPRITGVDALVAAWLAGDRAAVAEAGSGLLARARAERPALVVEAAEAGRTAAVPLLAELGFDLDARLDAATAARLRLGVPGGTALHWAAWRGDLGLTRLLLELGADPGVRDARFGTTPLEWARRASQDASAELLAD
ncbi:ankyrin repeat domain-containing protein [Actinomadura sp. DC4]|uniref:ankyrin repeat domain-containing protein n=1 Tax=Actinomadura sp. DC4 TaxID=3055069 RepID=UPI0025AF7AAF|nr:ankyrin repeat domain-containing protein [Actinomadura sp. DC4]MDN3359884.1 ankyrin repeat domain-containing protein [Actinomadura sp. DC4]